MMRVKNHQTPPTIRPERDLWKNTHHQIALKTFLDIFFSLLKRNSHAQQLFGPDPPGICEQVDCEPAPDSLPQESKLGVHLGSPSSTLSPVFQLKTRTVN